MNSACLKTKRSVCFESSAVGVNMARERTKVVPNMWRGCAKGEPSFQSSLLFSAISYPIHHMEEHMLGNFRAWRTTYFPHNNKLTSEAVVCILMTVGLLHMILFNVKKTKRSAQLCIFFIMTTQVTNAIFHVVFGIYFWHYSPGTITAVLLYLGLNGFILQRAVAEGWVDCRILTLLFLAGTVIFYMFEFVGPVVIPVAVSLSVGCVLLDPSAEAKLE